MEVVGASLGELLRRHRREQKSRLDDSVRGLRLELTELGTLLHQLREILATEASAIARIKRIDALIN
jgi:hypothetical protein